MKPSTIIFLVCVISLVIDILVTFKFSAIAEMKGHEGYFWWCFWLGAIGWMMVIALPDRGIAPSRPDGGFRISQEPQKTQPAPQKEERLPEL